MQGVFFSYLSSFLSYKAIYLHYTILIYNLHINKSKFFSYIADTLMEGDDTMNQINTNNINSSYLDTNTSNNKNTSDKESWNSAFSRAQNTYSNSPNKITSTQMNLQAKMIEYERYKNLNDLERKFQEQNLYNKDDITNPFHYTKTNNHFTNDIKKEFEKEYGKWDGEAIDSENGFAYVDKYGYSHVSSNFFRAMIYSKDGRVYNYEGDYVGGYAVDAKGRTIALMGMEGVAPLEKQNVAQLPDSVVKIKEEDKNVHATNQEEKINTSSTDDVKSTYKAYNPNYKVENKENKIGYDLVSFEKLSLYQINLDLIRYRYQQSLLF